MRLDTAWFAVLVVFGLSALLFGLSLALAPRYIPSLGARSWEKSASYSADDMARWARDHPGEARGYVMPLVFPIDVLFLACFAAGCALASVLLAERFPALAAIAWLFAVVPVAYAAADLFEDTILARALVAPDRVAALIGTLQAATRLKLALLAASAAQVVLLAVGVLIRRVTT